MPSYQDIPQFTRHPNYRVTVGLKYLPGAVDRYVQEYACDLDPDFQRSHVWDEAKQIAFVEYLLRGGQSGRDIYFNCKGWMGNAEHVSMVLVDGKQRLEACRRFLDNEIPVFGTLRIAWTGFFPTTASLNFCVNDLATRAEVLKWYLDLNTGGVVHTDQEIEKVKHLLKIEEAYQLVSARNPSLTDS